MRVQNQKVPMDGVTLHALFDPINTMYVVVGHSVGLEDVMSE